MVKFKNPKVHTDSLKMSASLFNVEHLNKNMLQRHQKNEFRTALRKYLQKKKLQLSLSLILCYVDGSAWWSERTFVEFLF